jgi:hypothetical protein
VVAFLLMVATVAAAQPKDILFVTSQGLAQVNPDGTGLTLLNLQGKPLIGRLMGRSLLS